MEEAGAPKQWVLKPLQLDIKWFLNFCGILISVLIERFL